MPVKLSDTFLQMIKKGAVLAPMAGVTDMPFRRLCLEMGAVYAVTEMVSAKGYTMSGEKQRAARELLMTDSSEQGRVALQLFGHEPDVVAEAAERLSATGRYFMIDLNAGCPVPKVCKNGEGAALMRDPQRAYEVMRALAEASSVPVSVKMRLGYEEGRDAYLDIAHLAERAGVALLTLHARTRSQYYAGRADWEKIRRLKSECSLPVIGNGDIVDGASAFRMLEETGCDGIAVGRAAEGNPFLFSEIRTVLSGMPWTPPALEERQAVLLRHAEELCAFKGEAVGIREMRRHVISYVRGCRGAAELRRKINTVSTLAELTDAVSTFFRTTEPAL